jgi:ferredoxin
MEIITYFLPHSKLQDFINDLQQAGYCCIGPQIKDGAIVYDELITSEQLPWGMRDYQTPGEYRLEKIPQYEAFAFANGPQAIKPQLFKPSETVWRVKRNAQGKLEFQSENLPKKPLAIFGARACDLAAMAIQDQLFIEKEYQATPYRQRREQLFIIAMQCTYSSDNCFCVSAQTGPWVKHPVDLLMTEIPEGFTVKIGSEKAKNILAQLNLSPTIPEQNAMANKRVQEAADMQTKRIPFDNSIELRDLLFNNLEHPRWDEVAERCLSCGNCTSVCPTCFCHSEVDQPTLDGKSSEHVREWDSCFTDGHSYLNGAGPIRDDIRKRYRQWLTHKVGSWFDQFDTSGCVGCGRCLTWCPVGIDITEELAAMSGQSNIKEK